MLNLHRLLFKTDDPASFHALLLPTETQRLTLTDAKNDIRDHLRVALADASVSVFQMPRRIEPRFRTQGSWSYRTCIQPAHLPPQEMDWDLGVYLPTTVWTGTHPDFAAKAYFDLVERSLQVLCKKKGGDWQLATGARCKDRCIRVRISAWAHIDVTLYAAPEIEFIKITELVKADSVRMRSILAKDDAQYLRESADAGELADFPWERLDQIMLATRGGEWRPSDPFAVTRWFAESIEEHNEQLRRLCRYLKAWRDYQWPQGDGPSSLLLMICAVEAFEAHLARDDLVLQEAAQRMSALLRNDVFVSGIDEGRENFNALDETQRREAADRADALRWALQLGRGFAGSMKRDALRKLQALLGPRVPSDPDLIESEGEADRVRSTPAVTVAAPVVRSTRSG